MTTLAPVKAEAGQRIEYFAPVVNLHQDGDGFTLEVEMPGVGKQGVEVTIDAARISARIEQGLLTVHLPKTEAVKPRKITVG